MIAGGQHIVVQFPETGVGPGVEGCAGAGNGGPFFRQHVIGVDGDTGHEVEPVRYLVGKGGVAEDAVTAIVLVVLIDVPVHVVIEPCKQPRRRQCVGPVPGDVLMVSVISLLLFFIIDIGLSVLPEDDVGVTIAVVAGGIAAQGIILGVIGRSGNGEFVI